MGTWGRIMHVAGAALAAWREGAINSDTLSDDVVFGEWQSRRLRYDLYWSYFQNNAYSKVHNWAAKFKEDLKLYKHVRHIYNPAYRLGEFWATHLMGGGLDRNAGDGKAVPSALPILCDNPAIRPALARIWQDGRIQVQKTVWTRQGAVMGDCAWKVIDRPGLTPQGGNDPDRGKVYPEPVHPARIKRVDFDPWGNVTGYILEYWRPDPDFVGAESLELGPLASAYKRPVVYTEVAQLDGSKAQVRYTTYKNWQLYPWNGRQADWREPYPFVPLFMARHADMGTPWGWSEFHPVQSKVREVDDLASKLSDSIRKQAEGAWAFIGCAPGNMKRADDPEKDDITIFTLPKDGAIHPLVMPLDVSGVMEAITGINEEIERDYPELRFDRLRAAGQVSGKALSVAREAAEAKVYERRTGYDEALRRAQMACLTIGAIREYPAFRAFDGLSYDRGDLEHWIAPDRPVFPADPSEKLDNEGQFWTNAQTAVNAGCPLRVYLQREGWAEADIQAVEEAAEADAAKSRESFMAAQEAAAGQDGDPGLGQ